MKPTRAQRAWAFVSAGWTRARPYLCSLAFLLSFVAIAVVVRGRAIGHLQTLGPDEAELMDMGRAAMSSPVPFTTWTPTTDGPVWGWFLATLGKLGIPLTVGVAHVLSAVLVGVIGYESFLLFGRWLRPSFAFGVTLLLWFPFAIGAPLGDSPDFGGLSTELLPLVLLLAGLCIPRARLASHPWWWTVVGLSAGLAVLAKFQVAPLAIAIPLVFLVTGELPWRRWLRPLLRWGLGAAIPLVVLVGVMLLTPGVSWVLVKQNFVFLADYGSRIDASSRAENVWGLLLSSHYYAMLALALFVTVLISKPRTILARVILATSALVAVYAGGGGFGHYMNIYVSAVVVAIALVPDDVPSGVANHMAVRWRVLSLASVGVLTLSSLMVIYWNEVEFSSPREIAAALSPDSGAVDIRLAAVCPPGSTVLVWGWSPELYLYQSWTNAIPYMVSGPITAPVGNRESGLALVTEAIQDDETQCIVDADGRRFNVPLLLDMYPSLRPFLDAEYTVEYGLNGCEQCAVWTRNSSTSSGGK